MTSEPSTQVERLSQDEKDQLLRLARQALEQGVNQQPVTPPDYTRLSPRLREEGACFVTLTNHGQLRGCIGSIEPRQPLAEDVQEHAVDAALQDYRFPPVEPLELTDIEIEISRLTVPAPLEYQNPTDLPEALRPGIDGVILRDGWRRATFLPQVWEKIPDPEEFLALLCQKMGAPADLWKRRKLEVSIYQVEEFHEPR
jgi:AmmeMemoRadiSam system protein A